MNLCVHRWEPVWLGAIACVSLAVRGAAEPNIPFMNLTTAESPAYVSVTDGQAGNALLMHVRKAGVVSLYDASNTLVTLGSGDVTLDFAPATRKDGFTLTLTIDNTSMTTIDHLNVELSGIWLLPDINDRNFAAYGQPEWIETVDIDADNDGFYEPPPGGTEPYVAQGRYYTYPGSYSPVVVFHSRSISTPSDPDPRDYAVGISLEYDVLNRKHDLRWIMRQSTQRHDSTAPSGREHPNWRYMLEMNPQNSPTYNADGILEPGHTAQYKVHVRVARTDRGAPPNWWLRTLEVYRRSFMQNYGGVEYTRDPRPIDPIIPTYPWMCVYNDPFRTHGFWSAQYDIEVLGFQPVIDEFDDRAYRFGYERHMLWTPAGFYCTGGSNGKTTNPFNQPARFTSEWANMPNVDPSVLTAWGASNVLGLWWGNADDIHPSWNPVTSYPLDPSDPVLTAIAFNEFDGALDAGMSELGLDSITSMPLWQGYGWLQTLKNRAATQSRDIKLIAEPSACDLIHRRAVNYVNSFSPNVGWYGSSIPHPQFLPNFILPGHETWYALHETYVDEPTEQAKYLVIAGMGFNVLDLAVNDLRDGAINTGPGTSADPAYFAAPAWETLTPMQVLRCNVADVAFDDGTAIMTQVWDQTTLARTNSGLTSADFFTFWDLYNANDPAANIVYDDGTPLPPFGYSDTATDSGLTFDDYYWYSQYYYYYTNLSSSGCN